MAQSAKAETFKHIKYVGKRPPKDQDNHCREKLAHIVKDVGCFHELYPEKLYLICLANDEDSTAFCENQLAINPQSPFIFWSFRDAPGFNYEGFNKDFGPFNLATTHLFCSKLKIWFDTQHLRDPDKYVAIVLDDSDCKQKLNAKLATAISAMVLLNLTDKEVMQQLNFHMTYKGTVGEPRKELRFKDTTSTFTDVSGFRSILQLTLKDCVEAFYAAMQAKFYNYYEFDHSEYLFYETVMSGDLNWIVPNKILAFAGPCDLNKGIMHHRHPPSFYYHYFKDHNVSTIIRLNEPEYDSSGFTDYGFDHFDLIFPDGYPPTSTIAAKFIKIVDEAKGAVAVHCYAGIGRTGTLIAAYLMKRFQFTVSMAIAWTRICRPGSVIGFQQDWLFSKFKPNSIEKLIDKQANKIKKSQLDKSMAEEETKKWLERHNAPSGTEAQASSSYETAEKAYGQAKALLLAKNKREKLDRSCNMSKSTIASSVSKKANDGDRNHQSNSRKIDLVLDLGKTIPMKPLSVDFKGLKIVQNSKFYRIKDGKYEWKVKLPKSGYVDLIYESNESQPDDPFTMRDGRLSFVYKSLEDASKQEVISSSKKSPMTTTTTIPLPKLKPIVYYSIVC